MILWSRLPIPTLDIAGVPSDYDPNSMPESVEPDISFCDAVIFEVNVCKIAATQFPEDMNFVFHFLRSESKRRDHKHLQCENKNTYIKDYMFLCENCK